MLRDENVTRCYVTKILQDVTKMALNQEKDWTGRTGLLATTVYYIRCQCECACYRVFQTIVVMPAYRGISQKFDLLLG